MAQTYTFNRSQADDIIQTPVSKIKHNGTTYEIKDATARATLATKQDTLSTQTAYTSKGSATKVPQITTNTLGQVTGITEVTITQPTVNNSTITIQKNSTTVDSFTLNQSSAKTINISVPTTAADVGAVPTSRTINSKALSSDITLTASDVGAISSHQSIKTLKTDNTTAQTTSSSEAIAGSGTINLHKVSKTGSYDDLLNKPTIPSAQVNSDWNASSGVAQILNKPTIPTVNDATLTIQKNGTTVNTFTANASSNVTANISVPTTVAELSDSSDYVQTASLETAATVAKTGSYDDLTDKPTADTFGAITRFYNGWFSNQIEDSMQYGDGLCKGFFTAFNLLHAVKDNFYMAHKGLFTGTPATVSCNYYDPYAYDFVNGDFGRYDTNVNPSTAFSTTPFVFEIKCPSSFEYTDVCRLFIVGHRIGTPFNVTKYKLETAYAYSNGTYTWGTVVDYNGESVDITRKYYSLLTSAAGQSYHEIYGVRLTISESSETVFTLAEIMLLCSRGYEKKSEAFNSLDLSGGKVVGNITIPTDYGSFIGNLTGNVTGNVSGNVTGNVSGSATKLAESDTRSTNENPSYYMSNYPHGIVSEFKILSTIGISTTGWFGQLQTYVQWDDSSGGYPTQIAIDPADNKVYRRVGTGNSTWSSWKEMADYPTVVTDNGDTISVAIAENTDYKFTNAAITSITFSSCANSHLESSIEFDTGSTAPTLVDNSGITWVAGAAPVLNASKHYVIVIYNKQGFVKEY